jgi:L-histidine N-alpha-methyltransferase
MQVAQELEVQGLGVQELGVSLEEVGRVRLDAPAAPVRVQVDVHLRPGELSWGLRAAVSEGLTGPRKELQPKWFYDDAGSALFDAITRLPEYYPTRTERGILAARAVEVARLSGADALVELGSGTSEKTRLLLDALWERGGLERFVPFDVSEGTLREAAAQVAAAYPGLAVHAVVGDFERHLGLLPRGGRRLVAFLGGTLGNLKPPQRRAFLGRLAQGMGKGESLLLGADLVKERERLVAAYDDAAGVTAAFNRNVLVRINRELGADFRPERFAHVARFDEEAQWVEMRLRSEVHQVVRVPALELLLHFEAGEEVRTEVSAKFTPARLEAELAEAGFTVRELWTDGAGDFSLTLAERR